MRPRINTATTTSNQYGKEVYTIQYHNNIFFYKRVEAILKTQKVAVKKGTSITMLLNGRPFIQFDERGKYKYIYNPNEDKVTSPELKKLFIEKGYSVN